MLAHQTSGRGSDSYLSALNENRMQPPAASDVNRSWQYDKAYNITAIDDHRWRRMQYRYNQNDQIENTSFGGLYPQTEQFSYDTNLNIRQQTLIPGEAQGALHQLSQQQQAGRVVRRTTATGHFDYHYDINGRLERKTEHRNGFRPREWRYQWDTLNQLASCFTPQGDCWRYTYDAFGRRLNKYQVVDAQEPIHLRHLNLPPVIRGWQYLWSGNQMIEETPVYADGTVTYDSGIQWLYESGSLTPAARYEKGKLHYLVTDHQGTPREIFTESGTVSWAARPDTWGQMAFWSLKTSANDPNYTECHFRFAGQYEDAETGLYYNRFHYYDRETGQYISPDPIGLEGGLNPYGYVHCPVGWVDPFGLAGSSSADLVQKINGRNPINSKYAGQVYPVELLPLEIRGKYPHSVPFTLTGFPDFSRYAIKNVRITPGNSRAVDFARADEMAGYSKQNPRPSDYTWHHDKDTGCSNRYTRCSKTHRWDCKWKIR